MTPIIIVKPLVKLSPKQVSENRERVLDAALRLFRARGFDRVSVSDLMREAGLTHGGFYNHFESKTELAGEACARAFGLSLEALRQTGNPSPGRAKGLRGYVSRYLSRTWRDAEAAHCPMVAFAADAARDPDSIATPFATGVNAYLDELASLFEGDAASRRRQAVLLAATLIGALALARATRPGDPDLSDEIVASARAELLARLPEG